MKHLAQAVIELAVFLEFSEDDVVDSDSAIKALEQMGATLQECSEGEKAALQECLKEARDAEAESEAREELLEFLDNFLSYAGIGEPEDTSPA